MNEAAANETRNNENHVSNNNLNQDGLSRMEPGQAGSSQPQPGQAGQDRPEPVNEVPEDYKSSELLTIKQAIEILRGAGVPRCTSKRT